MKAKTFYVCSECGYQSSKWLGRCPECDAWNTFEEQTTAPEPSGKAARRAASVNAHSPGRALPLTQLDSDSNLRMSSGMSELDRVLGGGVVRGSAVLLSGEPGIGKSTLLLQISNSLATERRVLYISGEESPGQIRLRAERLGADSENLYVLAETSLENALGQVDAISPEVIVADSIQTLWTSDAVSTPGSVTQVRECAARLIALAKSRGVAVIMVGHVNKEGGIAGPKILEHMVDAVLCFEGEQRHAYRVIRATKNRFGSISELGVFEMTGIGLREVQNPSEALMAGRPKNVSGSCAVCIVEGTRPIIAEIQSLSSPTVFPSPRRTATGFDYNRLCLLLAVLEKRLGLRFSGSDVYLNVVGGLRIDEPAADLPAALALISSVKDMPLDDGLIAVGEIGLAGEIRAVSMLETRVREAERLGFTKILVPARGSELERLKSTSITPVPVKSVFEAMEAALGGAVNA